MGFTWGLRFYHLCKAEPDMRLTLVKPRTLTSVKTGADFLVFLMVLARYRIQEEHSSFWNAPTNSGGIIRVEKGTSDYTVKLRTPPQASLQVRAERGCGGNEISTPDSQVLSSLASLFQGGTEYRRLWLLILHTIVPSPD
jgi:hypothetical protein